MRFAPLLVIALSCALVLGDETLETVRLIDGRSYYGLIEAERKNELDFAEIVRAPGKPMYAVVRPIDRKLVAKLERLGPEERERLATRFLAFRNRAHIEAGRLEDVRLAAVERGGAPRLEYEGNWFRLSSTADDETTRKAVVRIEQVFRAYRQLLPPRRNPRLPLEILLFGSLVEYRADLAERGLDIENAAFYSANRNLIVAGSDLARYSEQLARTRLQNAEARRHYESLQGDFRKRLATISDDLRRGGYTGEEIADEIRLRRRIWSDEMKARFADITEADRKNEALFGDVTRQMFARLNHEAFHAYLENFVYPSREGGVPRWLNEGLAQVFETAQLDGDVLRIDAPHREALRALQADLAAAPLPLADLLSAGEEAFLVTHAGGASQRHYLYSWGLAYYLAFHQNLLGSTLFERYLWPADADISPIARFEKQAGTPLGEFEKRWWADMRALKAPAK